MVVESHERILHNKYIGQTMIDVSQYMEEVRQPISVDTHLVMDYAANLFLSSNTQIAYHCTVLPVVQKRVQLELVNKKNANDKDRGKLDVTLHWRYNMDSEGKT